MTVSEDFRTATVAVVPAQATPVPATTVPAATVPALPSPAESPEASLSTRVRTAVDALRQGMEDGTVHHHRRGGVPESWTAVGVEVVRAWAAGLDVDEQLRACPTCTPVG